MTTDAILAEVVAARREIDRTVRSDWPPERWLAALGERVGAVCQAVIRGGHDADLRAALVEVAAVCGAWRDALGGDASFLTRVMVMQGCLASQGLAYLVDHLGRIAGELDGSRPDLNWVSSRLVTMAAVAVAWAVSLDRAEEGGRNG